MNPKELLNDAGLKLDQAGAEVLLSVMNMRKSVPVPQGWLPDPLNHVDAELKNMAEQMSTIRKRLLEILPNLPDLK